MVEIIGWFQAHWTEIASAVILVVVAARAIVKLTPTPKDDTVLEKIVEFLKHLGLHVKDE